MRFTNEPYKQQYQALGAIDMERNHFREESDAYYFTSFKIYGEMKASDFLLVKLNKSDLQVSTEPIFKGDSYLINGESPSFAGDLKFGNRNYTTFSLYDKKTKNTDCFYVEMNDKYQPIGSLTKFTSFKTNPDAFSGIAFEGLTDGAGFYLLTQTLNGVEKGSDSEYNLVFYDMNFVKTQEFNFTSALFSSSTGSFEQISKIGYVPYELDKNKNIFMPLCFDNIATKQKGDYFFELHKFNPTTNSTQTLRLDLVSNMKDLSIYKFTEKEYWCLGHIEDEKSKEVTGFYRYVIDYENFKIISSNTYMYDQELIQKTNNKKGKELTGISNLSGAGIYMLSDGGYYVCGSQTEASAYGSSLDANTFMGTSYALRSIVVTRCNKNGEVLWSKLIPTGGSHNVSSSYYPELIGDELYLIFTDHKENLNATSMMEVKVADSSKKPKDIVVMLAILNPIGDLKKQIIHTSDEYVRIEPGNLFRPDKNEKKWLGSFSADGMFKESFVEIILQ